MLTYKLFTQPNCHKCPAVKDWLYKSFDLVHCLSDDVNVSDIIQEIDCSTESGFQLAKLNNIISTPTIIVEDDGIEIKRIYEVPK